jgi:uncharacterized repeat protein (TIGR03803 family)
MRNNTPLLLLLTAFTLVSGFPAIAAPVLASAAGQVLYSFCSLTNCPDGNRPSGSLILDSAGNLYGTTAFGGDFPNCGGGDTGCGVIFQLTPGANDTWTETVLYSFCSQTNCADGEIPTGGLISDASGNLYGATSDGGTATECSTYGCGTVFELSPGANGVWTETVLYSFTGKDGYAPQGGVTLGANGNLYGTTVFGGVSYGSGCGLDGCGTVFQLAPGGNGTWTETMLYSFCSASGCTDGSGPTGRLIFGKAGNLYGTTQGGGINDMGTVFELSPEKNGTWKEKVLHSFNNNGTDGYAPIAGVIRSANGSLYGTTLYGGGYRPRGCEYDHGCGAVFELKPGKNEQWTEKIIDDWGTRKRDSNPPENPLAGLIFDKAGNLYGTTEWGGGSEGCGTVFDLKPGKNGEWKTSVVYTFSCTGEYGDGSYPLDLMMDGAGNIYGTTEVGGRGSGVGCDNYGCGTAYKITP